MPQEDNTRQQEIEQTRQYWKTRITNWQASRMSQTEYCRRHELTFHQFVYWRRKFAPKAANPIPLIQVPTAAVARAAGLGSMPPVLRVALAPDFCIEVSPGFDPPTLQQVVTALRGIQ